MHAIASSLWSLLPKLRAWTVFFVRRLVRRKCCEIAHDPTAPVCSRCHGQLHAVVCLLARDLWQPVTTFPPRKTWRGRTDCQCSSAAHFLGTVALLSSPQGGVGSGVNASECSSIHSVSTLLQWETRCGGVHWDWGARIPVPVWGMDVRDGMWGLCSGVSWFWCRAWGLQSPSSGKRVLYRASLCFPLPLHVCVGGWGSRAKHCGILED